MEQKPDTHMPEFRTEMPLDCEKVGRHDRLFIHDTNAPENGNSARKTGIGDFDLAGCAGSWAGPMACDVCDSAQCGDIKLERVGEGVKFDRIRRITGYLVGTIDRFNNAKRAEVHDRVKHTPGKS